jgi:predicted metal-dependent phosphoesterase TrpH
VIDLQIHTNDSDGTWSWKQVLEKCLDLNLTAFAITDHDTTVRRGDILAWGKANDAMAIPGIELSTCEDEQTIHLLGYFLDGPLDKLEAQLDFLRTGRLQRNKKIVAKLQSLGVNVTEEDVLNAAGRATVGRPHIARLLMQKGVVKSMQEAFDRFLSANGQAYYPKVELPLREAIELLHGAGAVTSISHPGLLKRTPEALEASLKLWRSWGLDGLEALYPSYSLEQTAFFDRIADKYGFLKTGGSDFHGDNKPHIQIGTGTGHLHVPDELLAPLLNKREEIRRALRHSGA